MNKTEKMIVLMDKKMADRIYECRNTHPEYMRYGASQMVRELIDIGLNAIMEREAEAAKSRK